MNSLTAEVNGVEEQHVTGSMFSHAGSRRLRRAVVKLYANRRRRAFSSRNRRQRRQCCGRHQRGESRRGSAQQNNPMRPGRGCATGLFRFFLKENSTALASGELEALTEAWAVWALVRAHATAQHCEGQGASCFAHPPRWPAPWRSSLAISPDGQLDLESGLLEVAGDNARRVFLFPLAESGASGEY